MKYDTSIYRGVFCALNAIYDENDNINTDAIKALVTKYKQLGVNGIYACGSTGEGFLLSTEERMQVAEAVKEAAGDDMAVIVHVGAASTKEACILARHAEKIGVSAVSAVPSVYYRLSEASIEKHWDTIMDSTELPFFIYNIPQLTGYDLSFELFEKMAKKDLKSAKIFKKSRFQVYLPCIKLIQRAKAIHINRISLFTNSSRIIFHTIIFTIYVNVLTIKTNSSRTHIRFFMSFTEQFRLHRMKHKYLIMMQIYRFYGKLHN